MRFAIAPIGGGPVSDVRLAADGYVSHEEATVAVADPSGLVNIGWLFDGKAGLAAPVAAAPTQAVLLAYAAAKQTTLRDGGITVNFGTASTPVEVDIASDVDGRDLVSGNVQYVGLCAQAGQAAPTFGWINNGGAKITLTSAQMMSVGLSLRSFVQATYDAVGVVNAAISAGTITTMAGVDAASWPATTY